MLAIAAGAAVMALPAAPAAAEIDDLDTLTAGCYGSVAGAVGMYGDTGSPADGISLDIPGPVVQVVVEWTGEFADRPDDPNLELDVSGPDGSIAGTIAPGQTFNDTTHVADTDVYGYLGDATDLFGDGSAGTYEVQVTSPTDPGAGDWWGATVTVVYDTAPCDDVVELIWKVGADHYFGGAGDEWVTTEPIVYEFGNPVTTDVNATVRAAQGGADTSTDTCRVSVVWAATGRGPAPDDLVGADGVPVQSGAVEGVVYPFTPPNQACLDPVANSPVVRTSGGHVDPKYSLIEMDVTLPAGSAWLALQLESPLDNNGHVGTPEDGAWGGAGLMEVTGTIVPDIAVEKTVLPGTNGACPGVEGTDELVTGAPADPVTYCFAVTNTGDTDLSSVTLDDPDLGVTTDDMTLVSGDDTTPLPPGGERVYAYTGTIDGDLVSSTAVTATPSDTSGEPLGVPNVTDTNTAGVDEVIPLPADIDLETTVLGGPGGSCPGTEGTDELVTALPGTPATYCFRAINTGEVALDPVALDDADLDITEVDMTLVSGDDGVALAPGDELVYAYDTTIDGDLLNTATVTGTPADNQNDVTDSNDAEVRTITPDTGVQLETTVSAGPGADCPGVNATDELVAGETGTPVAYCFRVINTGEAALFPVTIDDPGLGITEHEMNLVSGDDTVPLSAGGELVYRYETAITADLVNVATVTGTPVDAAGEPIETLAAVTDNDAAEVDELVLVVDIGAVCDNDTPYLDYDITADGLGAEATITFSDDGHSESVVVPVGSGRTLWPGAEVDDAGNPTDWPGWDLDANGEWYLNPDHPYAWARGDVDITVEVNPTSDPVTVSYPPPGPACSAAPPPTEPPPTDPPPTSPPPPTEPPVTELPATGASIGAFASMAVVLLTLGAAMLIVRGRRRGGNPN